MSRAFFPSPPKPQSRIVEFRKWMSFVVPKTSESLFPQTNTSKTESLLQNKSAFEVPGVSVSGFEEFLVPKFSETFGGIKRRPFRLALPNVTLLAGLDLTKHWLLWVLDWIELEALWHFNLRSPKTHALYQIELPTFSASGSGGCMA